MSRSHRRAAGSPPQEPATEARSLVAPGDEEDRRNLQALVEYFRLLAGVVAGGRT